MKELREQFEKETGVSVFWFDSNGQKCANPLYIDRLESKLKETQERAYNASDRLIACRNELNKVESKLKETQLHFLKAEKRALENWIKLEDERKHLIRMAFLQGADYESGQGDYSKNKDEEIGEAIANYINQQ